MFNNPYFFIDGQMINGSQPFVAINNLPRTSPLLNYPIQNPAIKNNDSHGNFTDFKTTPTIMLKFMGKDVED